MSDNICLVTRTFQPRKDIDNFDLERFEKKFLQPLKKMIKGNIIFKKVIILVNVEEGNKFAEILNENNVSPSEYHIKENLKEEVELGIVEILHVKNWGQNAGSARALRQGGEYAKSLGMDYLMNWSAEMDISVYDIISAFETMKNNNHDVMGFLREKWWLKFQWAISQNTASIWRIKPLSKVGYFSNFCDEETSSINSEAYGKIHLMGMEDFHAMARMLNNDSSFSWGMYGLKDPIQWKYESDLSTELGLLNAKKIYRQERVVYYYIEQIFKHDNHQEVLDNFFSKVKMY